MGDDVGIYDGTTSCSSATATIDSSNIGYRLLRKQGWQEGTGLGVSQQGRLEPVQAYQKSNKRGLGADKVKKAVPQVDEIRVSNVKTDTEPLPSKAKAKSRTKRMKKMAEEEKRLQEREFEREFFKLFWPDNV